MVVCVKYDLNSLIIDTKLYYYERMFAVWTFLFNSYIRIVF